MPRWWSWLVLPQRAKTYGFNSIADIGKKSGGELPRLAPPPPRLRQFEFILVVTRGTYVPITTNIFILGREMFVRPVLLIFILHLELQPAVFDWLRCLSPFID